MLAQVTLSQSSTGQYSDKKGLNFSYIMSQSGHKNYKNLAAFFRVCLTILGLYALTHFHQMLTFYVSWKHEKTFGFGILARNGLKGQNVLTSSQSLKTCYKDLLETNIKII